MNMDISNSNLRFCDGVRHLYIAGLNDITKCLDGGLRQWLRSSNNFIPASYGKDDFLDLIFYNSDEVLEALASDINRLSCAAVETNMNISESHVSKKFIAWVLINYYYSAFYSAHSLLKILGFGLVQIDNYIIQHINEVCTARGIQVPRLSAGLFCFEFHFDKNLLRFYKVTRYNDSHKGLWQRYYDMLNVFTGVYVATGQYDATCICARKPSEAHPQSLYECLPTNSAQLLISRIEGLRRVINTKGDNNWFSFMRNTINYSHGFGVWYPYKYYDTQYDNVVKMSHYFLLNPLSEIFNDMAEKDVVKYAKYCQLINALNIDVILDLANRNTFNKSFLKNGVIAFINQHQV